MKALLCSLAITFGAQLSAWAGASVDYSREIKPLFRDRCYACHGALKQKAGLRLDTGAAIRRGGKDGLIILTNDLAASPLLVRVASTNLDERMPPEGEPLTVGQIDLLRSWITQGAASPANEKPDPDPREHWAFKPPVRPPLPNTTHHASRIASPIDVFISAGLEEHGLVPLPEAPKAVLLRRVYLDLIGLPPTREELHAFLADSAPDAYERVVQRLLDSPRYGERWARHWMDVWRYADWYGRRHVPDVWNSAPQVWRWREWIVNSLNADKGYDRMLVEMLAADEVAPEDNSARAATGYLVRNWYALNPNQWMRDIVEHTGKAFLGLTFNCAHCHDHKYDPISQRDYFQFRAFFEPLQVRQDRVPGEADPGPFQKYEYSANRKVVTNGIVSVFDENLGAKTFIYLRGDERSFPEGKPTVDPAMPAFLNGDSLKIQRLDLPRSAHYPGLKPFVQQAEMEKHEQNVVAARDSLTTATKKLVDARAKFAAAESTNALAARAIAFSDVLAAEVALRNQSNQAAVAEADLDALRARLAADRVRYGTLTRPSATLSPPDEERDGVRGDSEIGVGKQDKLGIEQTAAPKSAADDLAATASRIERLANLRKAEAKAVAADGALVLLQAEQAAVAARRNAEGASEKKEEKEKAEAALKKAQEQVAAAQRVVEAAQVALATNSIAYTPITPVYPEQSTGRRRALAGWLTSRDNPLTARVAVNHIWARHFHAPLVASVFDFGRNGSVPTNPELLDWLAVEFMEHGWSMKHLHRLIVTSSTYRTGSARVPPAVEASRGDTHSQNPETVGAAPTGARETRTLPEQIDPENKYLWRMNSDQMEAEVLRDSLLHLAGELDLSPTGYPLPNKEAETSRRRSLYFECFPEPGGQSEFATLFDPPGPTECYRRSKTIVPQQALALTNSRLSREQSRALAQRLSEAFPPNTDHGDLDFIAAACEQVLTRRPSGEELAACQDFLKRELEPATRQPTDGKEPGEPPSNALRARASLVHALFNHNDFVTIR